MQVFSMGRFGDNWGQTFEKFPFTVIMLPNKEMIETLNLINFSYSIKELQSTFRDVLACQYLPFYVKKLLKNKPTN